MAFSFGSLLQAVAKWAVTRASGEGAPRARAAAKAEKPSARAEDRAEKAERAAMAKEMRADERARVRERKAAEREEAREFKRQEAAKDRAARAESKAAKAKAGKPESKKAAAERADIESRKARAAEMKASAEARQRRWEAEERELDKSFKREMAGKGRPASKAAAAKAPAAKPAPEKAPAEKKAAKLKAFAEEGKAPAVGKSRIAGLESSFNKTAAASQRALAHTNAESGAPDHHAVGHRLHSQAAQLHFRQAKAAQAAGESKMAESHLNMGRRHRAIAEQHKVQHWGQGEQAAKPRALQRGKKGGTFYVSEGGRKVYVH